MLESELVNGHEKYPRDVVASGGAATPSHADDGGADRELIGTAGMREKGQP